MLYVWIILIIIGFAMLIKGADWFVDGAAGIASKCKIPALVIGLTVVAFGTSMPELAVSVTSALQQSTDIAIGNVVGSNITNILLILGFSAIVHNLPVQKNSMVLDIPALLIASVLLIVLGVWGSALQWWDGLILLAVFSVYMFLLFRSARKEQREMLARGEAPQEEKEEPKGRFGKWLNKMEEHLWFLIVLTLIGLGLIVGGGTLLVEGAQYIAEQLGVSERIIGLTVVALGTSLPELVTSVVAASKGETDIAVGNVIGSNIFNIFLVAGVAALFYPLSFTLAGNLVDALVALGAAVLLLLCVVLGKKKLGKVAGVLMVACFVGYYAYLFLV